MPTQTLPANTYIYFTFDITSGITGPRISFYIESEFPVDTYVVDDVEFGNYRAGAAFTSFGGVTNATAHRFNVRLPHAGRWYLVVVNHDFRPTAIHYDV
ncbi:MAG TPA: hypothetical protein VGA85_04610 [Dehalococcoidales bacterium]